MNLTKSIIFFKEVVGTNQSQIELTPCGTMTPNDGHTLFELEMATGAITPSEYMKDDMIDFVNGAVNAQLMARTRKVLIKSGYLYVVSLNKKNAAKHFMRLLTPLKAEYNPKEGKLVYEKP